MVPSRAPAFLLLLTASGICSGWVLKNNIKSPSFCKELECPRFKEVYTSEDYSIRRYEPSSWVSTTISGYDFEEAAEKAFYKLFDYIQGENDQKAKIPMTVPVINSVLPGKGPVCANNFTFSFFVPFEFQKNTPKPTNPALFLSSLDQHKVYVRVYGGFTNNDLLVKEAEALKNALNSSQPYDQALYYSAGYDSPLVLFGRHNEIWFFATD